MAHSAALAVTQLPRYTVTDLGTLGGTYSEAYGINKAGRVGWDATLLDGFQHAFLWDGGKMTGRGTQGDQTA